MVSNVTASQHHSLQEEALKDIKHASNIMKMKLLVNIFEGREVYVNSETLPVTRS